MKITKVHTHVYKAQAKRPINAIQPTTENPTPISRYVNGLLVELETSSGLVGYGESMVNAGGESTNLTTSNITSRIIDELISPSIIGKEIDDPEILWEHMNKLAGYHGRGGLLLDAISAIDTAVWDIIGKELGESISKLLCENNKQYIKVYASKIPGIRNQNDVSSFENNIKDVFSKGFKGIKIGGGLGVENDFLSFEKARQLSDKDTALMLDVFGAYDKKDAAILGSKIEGINPEWLECPIDPYDFEGYLQLSNKLNIKIGLDPIPDINVLKQILNGSDKIVSLIDVTRDGGITRFKKLASLIEKSKNEISVHSGWSMTAVGIAASLQMAASFDNLRWMEFRIQYDDNPLANDISKQSFEFKNGYIRIPSGPGIGIDIDLERISEFEI